MAKKKIDNYVFIPGISASDNLLPNAYDLLNRNVEFIKAEANAFITNRIIADSALTYYPNAVASLTANKEFLKEELSAWIEDQVRNNVEPFVDIQPTDYNSVKCKRDIGYFIQGSAYDVALGTNYNAVFLGIAESNSADLTSTVFDTISATKTEVAAITEVAANATAVSRSDAFYDEVLNIAQNGREVASAITFTNPTSGRSASQIAAKDQLMANIDFITAEINAWVNVNYPDHNHNVAKCTRDVKYAVESFAYDILYGGNSATYYNAKFFYYSGAAQITEAHQEQTVAAYGRLKTVVEQIVQGQTVTKSSGNTATQSTSGAVANSSDAATVAALCQVISDVVEFGTTSLPGTQTYPDIAWGLATEGAAILAASTDIIDTVVAVDTYIATKCKRDVGYIIDAYLTDLSYGGNTETARILHYYWLGGQPQVDGTRLPEAAAHAQLRDMITDYIFTNTAYPSLQSAQSQNTGLAAAESGAGARIDTLSQTVIDVIVDGLDELPTPQYGAVFRDYTYDTSKCSRDIGYVLSAYLNDLRYGGNVKTRYISSFYWIGQTPQVDGDRTPEAVVHEWIRDLLKNYIWNNTLYPSEQTSVDQVIDLTVTAESGADTRIDTLTEQLTAVIVNGPDYLPVLENGCSQVKVQGYWAPSDLLLVTNSQTNEIIYNFSDASLRGSFTYYRREDHIMDHRDPDFPSYLATADAITTIQLFADTTNMSASDSLQIFVEVPELAVRPYDFGTDAIERMRVAYPQSMLDADFEYGLQPTKWAAIGLQRGYPGVYEIPGTDLQVFSVSTDASTGTAGIGASLITVTTVGSHGLEAGDPITVKALGNSVSGFARAEGSFIVNTVVSSNQFTYYAQSKVGRNSGDTLATTYTQIRYGGFYTGAAIGRPVFSVYSEGNGGTITSKWITPEGSDLIAFTGTAPELGSPIVSSGVVSGTQVAAVYGTGGSVTTKQVTQNSLTGETTLTLENVSGVEEGMAVEDGAGTALFITNIVGTTLSLSGSLAEDILGDVNTFTNVAGSNDVSDGAGATFDVVLASGSYSSVTLNLAGDGYNVGDYVKIPGDNLGGASPDNDIIVRPTEVDTSGSILDFTYSGSGATGNAEYTGLSPDATGGSSGGTFNNLSPDSSSGTGLGAIFDITRVAGSYSATADTGGGDYAVNEQLTFLGTNLGGTTPANDCTITVDSVQQSYTNLSQGSTTGSGTGGTFNVTRVGTSYTAATVNSPGSNYSAGDDVVIPGTLLGGATTANDLTLNVEAVSQSYPTVIPDSTSGIGTGATFTISRSGTSYFSLIVSAGTGYTPGDTITILGTQLGGAAPANNCTLTVGTVGGTGDILTLSNTSGTATGTGSIDSVSIVSGTATGTGEIVTFTVSGTSSDQSLGTGAVFTVEKNLGVYSATATTAGSGYSVNDTIRIYGNRLGGLITVNDCVLTVSTIDGSGGILTVSAAGTGTTPDATFTNIISFYQQPVGTGARFSITRSGGSYSVTTTTAGSGYRIGERINVDGSDLDGEDITNDAVITISTVNGSGGVTDASISGAAVEGTDVQIWSTIGLSETTTDDIPDAQNIVVGTISTMEVEFTTPHGLVPGANILVDISSSGTNHVLAEGPFIVDQVPTINKIRYTARTSGTIDDSVEISGAIYPRPDTYFIHRPYDGGVQLGTGGPQHGAQAVRQSKKYIRYQSGKGIMYTTGALFAPSYDLQSLEADGVEPGSFITVTTDDVDHGLQVGGVVRIIGVVTSGYNGDYTVSDIVNERVFRIQANTSLSNTTAVLGSQSQVSILNWHGATVRAGAFDDQNGLYWQYDGHYVAVGRRSATFQLAGVVSVNADSNTVTGTNTRFRDQVQAGDRIVIRGMTHVVQNVISDTLMYINPDYRGVRNAVQAKLCKIQDQLFRQDEWNRDRLDGTGPSGYNIDITKMQMIGIQYSWYGAGFIDFMLRGADGNFVFAHRIRNSNVNTEAFMRTGNMPVRYEVINESARSYLSRGIDSQQLILPLADTTFFPEDGGIVYVDNELISFTGKTREYLTGCNRSVPMSAFQSGAQRTFTAGEAATHDEGTGVILVSNTISPIISHWGSAFLTDGGFDSDRGYIFNYASTGISVTTTKKTAFLIRLAPSVSNAIVGDLGDRELLNRAQLLLNGIEITSDTGTGGMVVEGVLNPQNYPTNPSDIAWGGLSGLGQGGQPSFAQIAPGGSVNWSSGTTQTTASAQTQGAMASTITTQYSSGNRTNYAYITTTSWTNSSAFVGVTVNDSKYPAGTTITTAINYGSYYLIYFSQPSNTNVGAGVNIVLSLGGTLVNTNYLYFQKTSFESISVALGTEVSDPTKFPAGTKVTSISGPDTFGATQYYRVNFNQNSIASIAGNTNITFLFGQPPYALPGETVFSFIANPGERAELTLEALKELTNTPLGGRGTYPNGPDVLAINVYKVTGSAINANIILRWGEAQA